MFSFQSRVSRFCNCSVQKDVLLVFPGKFKAPDPQVPLAFLHIAALSGKVLALEFSTCASKTTVKFRWTIQFCGHKLHERFANQVCLRICQMCEIRILLAHLFGAAFTHHLLPEQTAINDFVDIIVRGEAVII